MQRVAKLPLKQSDQPDHDDVEGEAECHLRKHQEQRTIDVVDAELIQRLAPVHQTEYDSHALQQIHVLVIVALWHCGAAIHCNGS